MSWTEETNYKSEQVDNDKVALGLKDVENALNKNNLLVENLLNEQKNYKEELSQALNNQFNQAINDLKNQKKEDWEVLASNFVNRLNDSTKEITNSQLETAQEEIDKNFAQKEQRLNNLISNIESAEHALNLLNNRINNIKSTERLQKQKQFFQEIVFILGAIIASLGTLLLVFAFCSALYSFGWHSIWHWKQITPVYNAPTFQKGLFITIKVILSILFFILGVLVMFSPLAIYHKFLNGIQNSYRGFGGWLNKMFIKKWDSSSVFFLSIRKIREHKN